MKTCHRLLKTSVNTTVAANSDKEYRHETTNRNMTVWLKGFKCLVAKFENGNNRCSTAGNRTECRDIIFVWKMWNIWHLKLNLICDCVHVNGWVAEVGGSDAGGSTSWIHTYIEDVAATTTTTTECTVTRRTGDLGMAIIYTTATCICTVVKMKNLLFICFYFIHFRILS